MIARSLPTAQQGALVWVNKAGRVRVSVVREVFNTCGLAECLPKREKRSIALRIAIKAWLHTRYGAKASRTMRLYPLDRRVLGFEVRQRVDGTEMNDHPYVCTIKANEQGAWVTHAGSPAPQAETDAVSNLYLERVEWYCPTTVGSLIKRAIVDRWYGTSLKHNGGLYFLHGRYLANYRALAAGLEASPSNPDSEVVLTCGVFNVADNPEVARDAVSSLREEIRQATDEINSDLVGGHEMTDAGREARKVRLDLLTKKAAEYSALFDAGLDDMRALVEGTQTALAMAELAEISG
jgi:hypothetical protein